MKHECLSFKKMLRRVFAASNNLIVHLPNNYDNISTSVVQNCYYRFPLWSGNWDTLKLVTWISWPCNSLSHSFIHPLNEASTRADKAVCQDTNKKKVLRDSEELMKCKCVLKQKLPTHKAMTIIVLLPKQVH